MSLGRDIAAQFMRDLGADLKAPRMTSVLGGRIQDAVSEAVVRACMILCNCDGLPFTDRPHADNCVLGEGRFKKAVLAALAVP